MRYLFLSLGLLTMVVSAQVGEVTFAQTTVTFNLPTREPFDPDEPLVPPGIPTDPPPFPPDEPPEPDPPSPPSCAVASGTYAPSCPPGNDPDVDP